MGIPKFFRWLSERYPLVNQTLVAGTLPPEIDNFYLDMNGIIHNCTHSNDPDKPFEPLTEEQMVLAIFQYIDKLFHVIKPKKVFMLAVDGVAPRAKLNQQRQRRFRSAKDAEEQRKKDREAGKLQEGEIFDSNCITPGTGFMARLSDHLRFFIQKKQQEDALWRKIRIIFSGHEVPGEGEHKIMDYIRRQKAQPGWDPQTSHCIHGLDADLIMLALTTHEPHFTLLREDVLNVSNKNKSKATILDFQLLHIALVREYLDLEFRSMSGALPFAYDLERVIDDFVLMCFFVGNDFLPCLPGTDIAEGTLSDMFSLYKRLLPELGGYLTDGPNLDMSRLETFLAGMSQQEQALFGEMELHLDRLDGDEDAPESRRAWKGERLMERMAEEAREFEEMRLQRDLQSIGVNANEDDADDAEDGVDADDSWKETYYLNKFKVPLSDRAYYDLLRRTYIEGLVWVLHYYHDGCVSWGWYFPYHYAPLCADLKNLSSLKFDFDLGTPFKPFQQLLAVLPKASQTLVPAPYRVLMTEADSPVAEFYPDDFKIDMNGKKNAWEGVVMIPFIDQQRLVAAIASIEQSLQHAKLDQALQAELARNTFGNNYVFTFKPNEKVVCRSTLRDKFSDIPDAHSIPEVYNHPPYPAGRHLGFRLCPGVRVGLEAYPFPSLHSLPFALKPTFKFANVNIFGRESRKESMVVAFDRPEPASPDALIAEGVKFIGSTCYVAWPFFREGRVVGLSDERGRYLAADDKTVSPMHSAGTAYSATDYRRLGRPNTVTAAGQPTQWRNVSFVPHSHDDVGFWRKGADWHRTNLFTKKAVETGEVAVLVHVKLFAGLNETADGAVVKRFNEQEDAFPMQLSVPRLPYPDVRLMERPAPPPAERFPLGSEVVLLSSEYLGAVGKVIGQTGPPHRSTHGCHVELSLYGPVPTFGKRLELESRERYYPLYQAAKRLNLSTRCLSMITGSAYFEPGKVNLGLCLKFSGRNEQVMGYSRKDPRADGSNAQWEFSERAVQLIEDYYRAFPQVFQVIENSQRSTDIGFSIEDLVAYDRAPQDASQPVSATPTRILAKPAANGASANPPPTPPPTPPPNGNGNGNGNGGDAASEPPGTPLEKRLGALGLISEIEVGPAPEVDPDEEEDPDDPDVIVRKLERARAVNNRTALQLVRDIKAWLKKQEVSKLPKVPCGSQGFTKELIARICSEGEKYAAQKPKPKVLHNVDPRSLLKPCHSLPTYVGTIRDPALGDRVVLISEEFGVPFGRHGTVVTVKEKHVDVVFDAEVLGATDLESNCKPLRGATLPCSVLFNLTAAANPQGNQNYQQTNFQYQQQQQQARSSPRPPPSPAPAASAPQIAQRPEQQQQQQRQGQQQQQPVQTQQAPRANGNGPVAASPAAQPGARADPEYIRRVREQYYKSFVKAQDPESQVGNILVSNPAAAPPVAASAAAAKPHQAAPQQQPSRQQQPATQQRPPPQQQPPAAPPPQQQRQQQQPQPARQAPPPQQAGKQQAPQAKQPYQPLQQQQQQQQRQQHQQQRQTQQPAPQPQRQPQSLPPAAGTASASASASAANQAPLQADDLAEYFRKLMMQGVPASGAEPAAPSQPPSAQPQRDAPQPQQQRNQRPASPKTKPAAGPAAAQQQPPQPQRPAHQPQQQQPPKQQPQQKPPQPAPKQPPAPAAPAAAVAVPLSPRTAAPDAGASDHFARLLQNAGLHVPPPPAAQQQQQQPPPTGVRPVAWAAQQSPAAASAAATAADQAHLLRLQQQMYAQMQAQILQQQQTFPLASASSQPPPPSQPPASVNDYYGAYLPGGFQGQLSYPQQPQPYTPSQSGQGRSNQGLSWQQEAMLNGAPGDSPYRGRGGRGRGRGGYRY